MAFPDRIERTVDVSQPPATVWAALTTAEGLSAWFGQQAAIDLENRTQVMVGQTEDASEAMRAFLEKRPPNYQNK